MRHLMLEYPDDPMTWQAENEYLLGTKILVAPVIAQGATTRSLYLPKGAWVDYWTGELLEGGRQVEVPAPLDRIPIMLRAGSIIPLIDPATETLASDLAGQNYRTLGNSLTWRIVPSNVDFHDEFTLADGSKAFVDRQGSRIEVRGTGSLQLMNYEIILPVSAAPKSVQLSGSSLKAIGDIGYKLHKKGWWLSTDRHTLHVLFSSTDLRWRLLTSDLCTFELPPNWERLAYFAEPSRKLLKNTGQFVHGRDSMREAACLLDSDMFGESSSSASFARHDPTGRNRNGGFRTQVRFGHSCSTQRNAHKSGNN